MSKTQGDAVFIIPAHNEATIIYKIIKPIVTAGYQVICVDDGSSDDTAMKAKSAGATVIKHILNLGQGASIETGFEFLRRGYVEYQFAVTFDADGQHQLSSVRDMIKTIKETNVNVVLGTRFKGHEFQGSYIKKVLLRISARIARYSLGIDVSDRHNGLRILDKEAVSKIRLTNPGFGHADEILKSIREHNLKFEECSVSILYTKYSLSKGQPLINIVNILFDKVVRTK